MCTVAFNMPQYCGIDLQMDLETQTHVSRKLQRDYKELFQRKYIYGLRDGVMSLYDQHLWYDAL